MKSLVENVAFPVVITVGLDTPATPEKRSFCEAGQI